MKKFLSEAYTEAKKLPKGLWVAAVIVPGGLVTVGLYLLIASSQKKSKTEKYLNPCCENEKRSMEGGCTNCGDPSF